MPATIACSGCGAAVAEGDGPTHDYLGASAGCFALFGEYLGGLGSASRHGPRLDRAICLFKIKKATY